MLDLLVVGRIAAVHDPERIRPVRGRLHGGFEDPIRLQYGQALHRRVIVCRLAAKRANPRNTAPP